MHFADQFTLCITLRTRHTDEFTATAYTITQNEKKTMNTHTKVHIVLWNI